MSERISNTQQKVTDAYRNNPFWDRPKRGLCPYCGLEGHDHDCIPEILKDIEARKVRCDICGGELDENGNCINLLEQQQ